MHFRVHLNNWQSIWFTMHDWLHKTNRERLKYGKLYLATLILSQPFTLNFSWLSGVSNNDNKMANINIKCLFSSYTHDFFIFAVKISWTCLLISVHIFPKKIFVQIPKQYSVVNSNTKCYLFKILLVFHLKLCNITFLKEQIINM